jgi:hypothetical protein
MIYLICVLIFSFCGLGLGFNIVCHNNIKTSLDKLVWILNMVGTAVLITMIILCVYVRIGIYQTFVSRYETAQYMINTYNKTPYDQEHNEIFKRDINEQLKYYQLLYASNSFWNKMLPKAINKIKPIQ